MTTKAPETVERYAFDKLAGAMRHCAAYGEFVYHSDYAAVVAERDELQSTLRHILDYIAEPAEDTVNGLKHDLRFIGNTCRAALAKQEPKE